MVKKPYLALDLWGVSAERNSDICTWCSQRFLNAGNNRIARVEALYFPQNLYCVPKEKELRDSMPEEMQVEDAPVSTEKVVVSSGQKKVKSKDRRNFT